MGKFDIVKDIRSFVNEINPISDEKLNKYSNFDSKEELVLYFESNGLDFNKIYEIESIFNPIWYIDIEAGVYFSLFVLDKATFEDFRAKEAIKQMYESQSWNLSNLEYYSFYRMIPEQLRYYDFSKRYKSIPKDKLLDAFESVYTGVDFGFSVWSEDVLDYIFSNIPKYSESDEYITIYRGASNESTPLELSHSWTESFSVAMWFATRFQMSDCTIYRAKIRKSSIIAYITNRDEAEVICNYNDLKDVEILPIQNVNNDTINEISENYMWTFSDYDYMIPDGVYGDGIHGLQHIRRVLLWSIILAEKLNLDAVMRDILYYIAILHDAGRVNDGECSMHGKASVDRIKKEDIAPYYLSSEDEYLAHKIIECHCISDKDGIESIQNDSGIEDKESAIELLKVFKDADALDRVRIKDLDYEQLRFDESKEMCLLSQVVFGRNLLK